jgi:L,D-transpeptidase ErfK/SrfK
MLALALTLLVVPIAASDPEAKAPRLLPVQGELQRALVETEDTLLDIAYRHHVGFEAVARLNRDVDVWIPAPGTIVLLPTRYILPTGAPQGLLLNVPEMRLYDFTVKPGPEVLAVAVGDPDVPTPVGEFRVGQKRTDPAWTVPESIRAEKPELPAVVPPGPDNPLGSRWLTIGSTTYGLHGTNIRWSIGRTATHGCVRLYEDDVLRLYERIPSGTRLQIVYQPYKWGALDGTLYLEVHPDLYGRVSAPLETALAVPRALGLLGDLDVAAVWDALERAAGIPVPVGELDAD